MIVYEPNDQLLPCSCGFIPIHISIAYGPTPYNVFCPNCKKQNWRPIGGMIDNMVKEWNDNVRLKPNEQLNDESKRYRIEVDKLYRDYGRYYTKFLHHIKI